MGSFQVFTNQPHASVDVLLITLPFGPLDKPSIGLSLLQSGLHQAGISSKILYLTLLFAKRIGINTYHDIAAGPYASLEQVGEWAFSPALFSKQDPNPYLTNVLFTEEPYHWEDVATRRAALETLSTHLLTVREQASDFIDACLAIALRYQPKIVGFTSTFQQQIASLALAKRLKERHPDIAVLFGGANVEGIMGVELIRQFPFVDAVVSGEGDRVVPDLVARLLKGRSINDIPGVYTYFNSDRISSTSLVPNTPSIQDIDSLPYPDYDDFFAQLNELALDIPVSVLYETSRGCWWGAKQHCTFCGLNGLTMRYRSKSSERAIEELVYLTRRYSGHPVAAVDNILDMTYFKTFLPTLTVLDLNLELFYEVKANLKKEQLRLLQQANICKIQPGIESLSTRVLQLMHKGIRALQNIQFLKWCKEFGIVPFWNLLWGFPSEVPEDYAQMAQLLALLAHLPPPNGGGQIRLDRFSLLFEAAEQHGLVDIRPAPCYRYIYENVPEQGLVNLAYYFAFTYQDERDVPNYTREVVQAMKTWRDSHARSFLYLLNHNDDIFIWDLRPIASTTIIRFTGFERALYLACDAIQGLDALARVAAPYVGACSREHVRELMQRFVDMNLMLVEEDTYLSLAVWLTSGAAHLLQYQQALAGLDHLQQLPEPCYIIEQPTGELR